LARLDLERLGPPLLALGAAAVLGVGLILAARSVNRPPVVLEVALDPKAAAPGARVTIRVRAEDSDGDALAYEFHADSGQIVVPDAARPEEARYTAPAAGAAVDRVTFTVTDARGMATRGSASLSIERPPAVTPTPEPELAPAAVAPPPTPAATVGVVIRQPPAATLPVPTPPPTRVPPNRSPMLDGGQLIAEVADGTVGLEARGSDPDGDPIRHAWDFGGCLDGLSSDTSRADVKLREGCDTGTAILTWTDARGAAASTMWTITR
jgi:hypothetical protein